MALLIPLLAICAFAQDVRYNFAGDVDFSKYKTFKWVQIKGADQIDQIADGQMKSAVNAELAKKGLSRTEAETADLFVGYQVSLGQEKEITTFDNGWGYGPGWGRGYGIAEAEDSARPQLRRLQSAKWTWTCTTRRQRSWCGAVRQAKRST